MLVEAKVIYLGHEEKSFTNSQGEVIEFKKGNFLYPSDTSSINLSIAKDVDMSGIAQLDNCHIAVNLYSDKSGYLRGRVEACTVVGASGKHTA
jgi:hypothetical protein